MHDRSSGLFGWRFRSSLRFDGGRGFTSLNIVLKIDDCRICVIRIVVIGAEKFSADVVRMIVKITSRYVVDRENVPDLPALLDRWKLGLFYARTVGNLEDDLSPMAPGMDFTRSDVQVKPDFLVLALRLNDAGIGKRTVFELQGELRLVFLEEGEEVLHEFAIGRLVIERVTLAATFQVFVGREVGILFDRVGTLRHLRDGFIFKFQKSRF